MFVYKDMSFCKSDCTNKKCERHDSHIDKNWKYGVAYADFSKQCEKYKPADKGGDGDILNS